MYSRKTKISPAAKENEMSEEERFWEWFEEALPRAILEALIAKGEKEAITLIAKEMSK